MAVIEISKRCLKRTLNQVCRWLKVLARGRAFRSLTNKQISCGNKRLPRLAHLHTSILGSTFRGIVAGNGLSFSVACYLNPIWV